jgi:hypothetical protein
MGLLEMLKLSNISNRSALSDLCRPLRGLYQFSCIGSRGSASLHPGLYADGRFAGLGEGSPARNGDSAREGVLIRADRGDTILHITYKKSCIRHDRGV